MYMEIPVSIIVLGSLMGKQVTELMCSKCAKKWEQEGRRS